MNCKLMNNFSCFLAHKRRLIWFSHRPHRPAQLAKGMLAIAIFITHGLNCYVAINITWTEYVEKRLSKDSPKLVWEYAVRTLLVLLTCKTDPKLKI